MVVVCDVFSFVVVSPFSFFFCFSPLISLPLFLSLFILFPSHDSDDAFLRRFNSSVISVWKTILMDFTLPFLRIFLRYIDDERSKKKFTFNSSNMLLLSLSFL